MRLTKGLGKKAIDKGCEGNPYPHCIRCAKTAEAPPQHPLGFRA